MSLPPQIETFATHVVTCQTCGREVGHIERGYDGKSMIQPCGHPARLNLVPNPRLASREG